MTDQAEVVEADTVAVEEATVVVVEEEEEVTVAVEEVTVMVDGQVVVASATAMATVVAAEAMAADGSPQVVTSGEILNSIFGKQLSAQSKQCLSGTRKHIGCRMQPSCDLLDTSDYMQYAFAAFAYNLVLQRQFGATKKHGQLFSSAAKCNLLGKGFFALILLKCSDRHLGVCDMCLLSSAARL